MNIFRNFRAALIDMDGVLYDSMPGHTLAWKKMMEQIGVECTRDEFYLYEGMTGIATINLLFQRTFGHGCDEEKARSLYEIKSRYFRQWGPADLMPGADRMLAVLKAGGLKRVLVTGSAQKNLLDSIENDYPGIFENDMRVTANDVTKGKPDPEPYLKGAALAGIRPEKALVIENAPLGVRAGKAAGCFTIAVTTGPIPREAFEKENADLIFDSMQDFASFVEMQFVQAYGSEPKLRQALAYLNPDKIFVLTDKNVRDAIKLDLTFADHIHSIDPGESSKDITNLSTIWRWLSASGATRNSVLINLGGGVVTDLGGFAASTFKRGMHFINVPTSLLAAADAAIGGKNAIDFNGIKNEIGSFALPDSVVILPDLLKTLPQKEMLSGFAEVIKMALLCDEKLYRHLLDDDAFVNEELLARATRTAAKTKEEIVTLDPKDLGLRHILNLGHTAGHAFESLAASKSCPLSHGEAVAYGIFAALLLSSKVCRLDEKECLIYKERILDRYYQPLPFGADETPELIRLMFHDKKNSGDGSITFILLEAIASPVEHQLTPENLGQVLRVMLDSV